MSGSGSENGIGKKENEFQEIEPLARWIQTASLIEIGHAGVGMFSFFIIFSHLVLYFAHYYTTTGLSCDTLFVS